MSDSVTHAAIVRSIADGEALVAVPVQGCASCGHRKACGVGKLAGGGRTTLLRVAACDGLKAGDSVTLSAEQGAINRAALLGYLLPALLIAIGAVVGDRVGRSDVAAALGACLGLVFALILTRAIPFFFSAAAAPLSLQPRR
ncbi:SoxR reducing system RseC family protein [Aromatoleum diolicum]|uniref:Positive regulator of sigma(E), RseC/MucC n=1 Tax=Aromatoleum diolicum TaxID=75796 RepID=A0ABX1Q848_9RHOO|nr:SoxR reducing system RseC family protein [Aromatoleum diolicum]NMG73349.1 hypothetical protein [Aromatoleum diolicum]